MDKERLNWIISGLDWDLLSNWEEAFVQSCEEYFKKYGHITKGQEDKLEEIYRFKAK